MPDIHLKYGGSTMARTINCRAWTRLSAGLTPTGGTNIAANHGSCLHECMESIVAGDSEPKEFLDVYFREWGPHGHPGRCWADDHRARGV